MDLDMRYKAAIIGLGNLGKRHLEGMLKTKFTMDIYCIDVRSMSLADLGDIKVEGDKKLLFHNNIDALPKELDIVIIATASGVRRIVFEQLCEHSNVKYIIFEKILFQRIEDYAPVFDLLQRKSIKAWVNCGRRESKEWSDIKKQIAHEEQFEIHMTGGGWGFCCVGIHLVDLVQFLNGEPIKIEQMDLSDKIMESKRQGYFETFGTIAGSGGRCRNYSITCYDNDMPLETILVSPNYRFRIYQSLCVMYVSSKENNWGEEKKEFVLPYVSAQMTWIVEKILLTGECDLPTYDESMNLHIQIEKPLIEFFEKHGFEKGLCPIT